MPDSNIIWENTRVKTPTLLQMEALECGAAALGIVLAYHGRYVPLEKLREDCGVNRNGSKASNMIKAARNYGLQGCGYRMEPSSLHTLKLPLILFWNFNHFIVLEGIKGDKVYINDPASGARTVSFKEFDQSFTGVTLALEPSPGFVKGGDKPSVIRALKKRLTIGRNALYFAILAGIALVIPGLVLPVLSKVFVDKILIEGTKDWFKPLLIGMLLTAFVRAVLTWLQDQTLLRQQTKLAIITSIDFFSHILKLPMSFFDQRYSGEIGSRVALNNTVAGLLTGSLASTCISLFTTVFFAAIMVLYDPLLTFIGVLFAATNIFILRLINKKRSDLQQRILQEGGKLSGTTMGGIQLIETIKATSSESDFFSRWAGQVAKYRNAVQEMSSWTNLIMPVPGFISGLSSAAILGLGALRVMDGEMTVGTLVAFQSLMSSFLSPFNRIVQLGTELQTLQGDINRLDDVMNYKHDSGYESKEEMSLKDGDRPLLTGHLEIRNLEFGYSKLDPPLIEDFNLTLTPGRRIALVGPSGSGKSTVGKLICGLLNPWSGEILFDGKHLKDIPRDVYLNSFSYVDQDIILFKGTIHDNLTMWNKAVPEHMIVEAARDACIHDTIVQRPGSYESVLDENGADLSGGQRQRLEIARALTCNPSLIVLDEATSALDVETEKIIDNNLRKRGCTCLIVAHRLSTIRDCDEIIVLERGRIVQRGVHDEMIKTAGPYRELIEN
ncbi:NHLP family bacteriocin export ABC transporter peptidase/permease/ATPase subunit [Maridesulfovibrio sp.]|uniref:NHLP family bacteriocin export ABC transporter peptidase/permease/ATPase subunit n=1 Tax=Maridesulfovibrio sp. TaxID=2795000 RepID=UPI0029F4C81D|nr:NHLP family bacteriocin export ABC transporter peptidase/permease/ATPase subunit [Maridesulfovibrio sp.]